MRPNFGLANDAALWWNRARRTYECRSGFDAMPVTVSIVEDNEQLRGTLARVIGRAEGFRCVSHYGTAEAALEGLPKDRPEVVLMDINLPGMNGVDCVRQLKPLLPAIQVLMLTVYEDTDTIFNALAAGLRATSSSAQRAPNCWRPFARSIAAALR